MNLILPGIQQKSGNGGFQQWLDSTSLPDVEIQVEQFQEECTAYRAMAREELKSYQESIGRQDTAAKACEQALQQSISTSEENAKLSTLLREKLALMVRYLGLLHKNYKYTGKSRTRSRESSMILRIVSD